MSKRKCLSVSEKLAVIQAIEGGVRKVDVEKRLGLAHSTVLSIWKNKEKILDSEHMNMKKMRKPNFAELDKVMIEWVREQIAIKMPISGPIVKAKAEFVAKSLNIENFKASEGWLSRFKGRHGIGKRKIHREPNFVRESVTLNLGTEEERENLGNEEESDSEEMTHVEALLMARKLKRWLQAKDGDQAVAQQMEEVEDRVQQLFWTRNTTLLDYFKPCQ